MCQFKWGSIVIVQLFMLVVLLAGRGNNNDQATAAMVTEVSQQWDDASGMQRFELHGVSNNIVQEFTAEMSNAMIPGLIILNNYGNMTTFEYRSSNGLYLIELVQFHDFVEIKVIKQ